MKREKMVNILKGGAEMMFRFAGMNQTESVQEDNTSDNEIMIIPDIPYTNRHGITLMLDVYQRRDLAKKSKPAIVFIHGGGLFTGSPKMSTGISKLFASHGYIVFVPSYRLMDQADAFGELEDISAGMNFISTKLNEFNADRNRVYLVVESAGAFLGIYATAISKSEVLQKEFNCSPAGLKFQAMGCFSGMFYTTARDMIGLTYPKILYGDRKSDRKFMSYMNPENKEVMDNLPPMYLTSSHADFLKKHTLRYCKALKENGNQAHLDFYPDKKLKHLIHAFPAIKPELQESRDVVKHLTDWFQRI